VVEIFREMMAEGLQPSSDIMGWGVVFVAWQQLS